MNNFKGILKPEEEILKNLFAVEGFLLFLAYWHYQVHLCSLFKFSFLAPESQTHAFKNPVYYTI